MTATGNVIQAFSTEHVVKLTRLSQGQLRYWDKTGFFSPRFASENRRSPYSRVYSFRDVVGLKTIALLLKEHGVSLQHLRKVASKLSSIKDPLWAETKLYVLNHEVHFQEPGTRRIRGALSGQYAMIPLVEIINNVADESKRLRERSMEQHGKLERHRYVAHNAWVIAGTRIPTAAIRRYHEAGYSIDQILREYPSLTDEDVRAALSHEERLAKSA